MNAPLPPSQPAPPSPQPLTTPAYKPSRRWLGNSIALLMLAATAGLAWWLTRPEYSAAPKAPAMAAGSAAPASVAAARLPASAVSGASAGSGSGSRRPGGGPGAVTVGVAVAEQGRFSLALDALGTVTSPASVRVRPQVSGVLEKVLFKEGQMVKAGDTLALLDARALQITLQQVAGQRLRDEAQLESAKVTLGRFQTLLQQDSIARQEVDSQAALVRQLEATRSVNIANENAAKLNLSYTRISAPISGRVGLRLVDVGNTVSGSDVNGIALITQIAPIDVLFALPQDQISTLQASLAGSDAKLKAVVQDRARSRTLATGVFAAFDNQIDPQTGTVKAKARFANADGALFPSQFVNVQLQIRTIEDAVTVPVTALRFSSKGEFVYVVNPQGRTVALRRVVSGPANAEKVVISEGLQAGEQVITEGGDRLKDGARVTLPGDAPGGGSGTGNRQPGERRANAASAAAATASSNPAAPAASP